MRPLKPSDPPTQLTDGPVVEGTLSRLARGSLLKEKGKDDKDRNTIMAENANSIAFNGLALASPSAEGNKLPTMMAGMSLDPHKNLAVSAYATVVERL